MNPFLVPQGEVAVPRVEGSGSLITEQYNGSPIQFEMINGRLMANFTSMCRAFGKKPEAWLRNKSTQELIEEMTKTRILVLADTQLVTTVHGGDSNGTWIDESLIIDAAGWLNVKFRIWCNDKIAELLRTGTTSIAPVRSLSRVELAKMYYETELALAEAQEELMIAAPKVEYHDTVLRSPDALITKTIALELGMTSQQLNKVLCAKGIQYKLSGRWFLTRNYLKEGLAINKTHIFNTTPDSERTTSYLVWTEKGRQFIHSLLGRRPSLPAGELPIPIV